MTNIEEIEAELKEKLKYGYEWWRLQNNERDGKTKFIYNIWKRDKLIEKLKEIYKDSWGNKKELFNYASNRRYNHWSAYWIELIFKNHPKVREELDQFHKSIDLYILDIPFDHKTSVYPWAYNKPIEYAQKNKRDLINRLYLNQSKQQRFHMKNRLFVIVYNKNWEHRKIKSELTFLKKIIYKYLDDFDIQKLEKFKFDWENVFSDIIWAIK